MNKENDNLKSEKNPVGRPSSGRRKFNVYCTQEQIFMVRDLLSFLNHKDYNALTSFFNTFASITDNETAYQTLWDLHDFYEKQAQEPIDLKYHALVPGDRSYTDYAKKNRDLLIKTHEKMKRERQNELIAKRKLRKATYGVQTKLKLNPILEKRPE